METQKKMVMRQTPPILVMIFCRLATLLVPAIREAALWVTR